MPVVEEIECVLLDIEGTICEISFVKETLFPYALQALPSVLSTQWDSPAFQPYRDAFPSEHRTSLGALQTHIADLTARDSKTPALKNLQGYLWQTGYESRAFSTPLFADVAPRLQQWQEDRKVAIYSSGSVRAQELFMAHVGDGKGGVKDLRGVIGGWFDTVNAGPKMEEDSYIKIAGELKIPPEKIVFLSDNVREVEAAIGAGMKALVVDRPGNAPLSAEDRQRLTVIESLEELELA